MADHILEVKGFNPFMYILIFEEFLINSALYEKDKLIEFMNIIKDNQSNSSEIEKFIKSIESTEDQLGGATVSTETLYSESKLFIEKAEGIIKKTIETKDTDLDLLFNTIVQKIAAMAMIARDGDANRQTTDKNLSDLIETMPYLLEQLTDYKKRLIATTDTKLKENIKKQNEDIDKLISFVNIANEKVNNASKRADRDPKEKPEIEFVKESNDKTIEILTEMLTTPDNAINIAAAKAILASAIAFASVGCLTLIKHANRAQSNIVEDGKKLAKEILKKAIDSIYAKINKESIEKQTDPDINKQIEETISILKKLCNPTNMTELFMEVVYFNEKSNAKSNTE